MAMAPIYLLFLESVPFGGILPDYISSFLLLITQYHGVNYKARQFILACGSLGTKVKELYLLMTFLLAGPKMSQSIMSNN